jgi:hypothetical protein
MLIKDFGYERVRKIMRLTFTTFSSLNPREKSDVATTLLLTLSFLLLTKEEFENIISKWVGSLKQSDYDSYGFFDEKIARSMVMTMIEPFIIKIVNRGVNEDGVGVSGVSIEFDLMYMLYNTLKTSLRNTAELEDEVQDQAQPDQDQQDLTDQPPTGSDGRCASDALIMALSIEFEEDFDNVMKVAESMKHSDHDTCSTCDMLETCLRMRLAFEDDDDLKVFTNIAISLGLYEGPSMLNLVASATPEILSTLKSVTETDYCGELVAMSKYEPFSIEHAQLRLSLWAAVLQSAFPMSDEKTTETVRFLEAEDIKAKMQSSELNKDMSSIPLHIRLEALLRFKGPEDSDS